MKTSTDKDNLNALIETEPEEFPNKEKDKNGQSKTKTGKHYTIYFEILTLKYILLPF